MIIIIIKEISFHGKDRLFQIVFNYKGSVSFDVLAEESTFTGTYYTRQFYQKLPGR